MKVEQRFLKYVSYHTTSAHDADAIPSTQRQFELAHALRQELTELGLSKVACDGHCYVYGLLPATPGCEGEKSIGLIAHMDTSPDYPGSQVKPRLISNYDGSDIPLANGIVIRVSDFPLLKQRVGKSIITTDGSTLLGADDKAGIAEILTAIEQIMKQKIPHGDIWVGFTPDEEVGAGADKFNLDYFQADYAYTVDGDYEGEISYENFNAASAVFQVQGVNVHPGAAKDIMVNAAAVGCEIQMLLPEKETPSHTEDRQGFYHLTDFTGTVASARLSYIIRDHDRELFAARQQTMRDIADKMNEKYGPGTVTLTLRESYRNMLEVMEEHPHVIERARRAIEACGLSPISRPVRGGTDGARLSFMGLPCPNLGTGGEAFHGPMEHVCVEAMEKTVEILIAILRAGIE